MQAVGDDEVGLEAGAPVWAVFGDLMAGLLGAFVLILVLVIGVQMELASQLAAEVQRREAEQQRRQTLEQALAGPLASGRITLVDGRIGIAGSVLFAPNADRLQPEGQALLKTLAAPLAAYLRARDELLMVSGFTDDKLLREGNRRYDDNLELSAQRAMTVTRALVEAGVPPDQVFAAAFGPAQPVASNADAAGRARNRRVEMAAVPRAAAAGRAASQPQVPSDSAAAAGQTAVQTPSDASAAVAPPAQTGAAAPVPAPGAASALPRPAPAR